MHRATEIGLYLTISETLLPAHHTGFIIGEVSMKGASNGIDYGVFGNVQEASGLSPKQVVIPNNRNSDIILF